MLILPKKSSISDAESYMHSTYPNGDLTHEERVAIFSFFVSIEVVGEVLILILGKFEVKVWICELVNPLISHKVGPRFDEFSLPVLLSLKVVVKPEKHNQISSSSYVSERILIGFRQDRCANLCGGDFDVLKEGSE
jgi:hypothetical protein